MLLAGLGTAVMAADFDGDGIGDIAVFRAGASLWSVRNVTRIYFGGSIDQALAPDKARAKGLLKTGQTFSPQTGDDGYYQAGISLNYTDNGNGTITDNATGLMWAKDGNGTGCNFGNQANYSSAVLWAQGLVWAVHRDWRLPNRRELESLVDAGRNSPAINPIFSNTKLGYYWSSTLQNSNPTGAWVVDFAAGDVVVNPTTNNYCVRVVRGGR